VSINNLPGSPTLPPPGARQSLSSRFAPNQQKKLMALQAENSKDALLKAA